MIQSDDHWLAVTDVFYAAAIGEQSWEVALDMLAQATGSQMGQLIGIGSKAAVPFNLITNIDPRFTPEFEKMGGGDPAINPRVKAGMGGRPLEVLAESDFINPEEYKKHPHLQEVRQRWGVAYICLSTLERRNGMLIGLAAGRTEQQGHISTSERACFASLAPHMRAAVLTQIALEGQRSALLTGVLESLSIPAFLCDRQGLVQAMTPSAEKLLSESCGLQLRLNMLCAHHPGESKMLEDAIKLAALGLSKPCEPLHCTILVHSKSEHQKPSVLDIIPLPKQWQHEFSFVPRVLVVIRGTNVEAEATASRRASLLELGYGLTASEIDVALKLAAGNSAETIAVARNASIDTVRTQIKTIRGKLHAASQLELIAKLNQI
jgi:DNA-binding CsgD family transcriptional regulator/PAS domain-containing protein